MQRSGEEARRERGDQPEDRERDRHRGRRGEEPAPRPRRNGYALGAVARARRSGHARFGSEGDRDEADQQGADEREERNGEGVADPLRESTRDQPSEAQSAEVRGGADDLRPVTAGARAGAGFEFRQPHRRRRRRRTDAEAAQDARDEQPGQRGPRHEHQPGDHVQRERRNQQPAATVDVGEVTGEDQADRDGDRIDGERERDRQRREAVATRKQ